MDQTTLATMAVAFVLAAAIAVALMMGPAPSPALATSSSSSIPSSFNIMQLTNEAKVLPIQRYDAF